MDQSRRVFVFSLGRTAYRIDLDGDDARAFESVLDRYVCAATAIGSVRISAQSRFGTRTRANGSDIREWAERNGIHLDEARPLPADTIDAYNAWRYAVQNGERERRGLPRSRQAIAISPDVALESPS